MDPNKPTLEDFKALILGVKAKTPSKEEPTADQKNGQEASKDGVEPEKLPSQGDWLNIVVDVYRDESRKIRLGVGRVTRDDAEAPFVTQITMLIPPAVKGRVYDNRKEKFYASRCPSQWTGEEGSAKSAKR